ncbi:hypothetical protein FKM82_006390 [Ascaphus truei]
MLWKAWQLLRSECGLVLSSPRWHNPSPAKERWPAHVFAHLGSHPSLTPSSPEIRLEPGSTVESWALAFLLVALPHNVPFYGWDSKSPFHPILLKA